MSTERDFDRIARAWLERDPTEAPDRAIEAALDSIARTPQVRRPLRWPFWRPTAMTRLPLLAALAGTVIVVIGLLLLGGGSPTPAPSPSTVPTSTPTEAAYPSPRPVPGDIAGSWFGASRGTAIEDPRGTFITFESPNIGNPTTFWVERRSFDDQIPAEAHAIAPGVLELHAESSTDGCSRDVAGRYGWSLSGDLQWLSIELIDDTCTDRASVLPGTWQRSLAHASRGGPGIAAIYEPYFTMTLPPAIYTGYGMRQVDTFAAETPTYTFKIWKDVDGFVDPCDIDAGRIDLEGLDGVLGYLTDDPRFTVTSREDFTIDGNPAVALEFTLGEAITGPCWPFDGDENDPSAVLTWIPNGSPDGFWNGRIGTKGWAVVTEVDGVSLLFEPLIVAGADVRFDFATLDTIRFIDELPTPPGR